MVLIRWWRLIGGQLQLSLAALACTTASEGARCARRRRLPAQGNWQERARQLIGLPRNPRSDNSRAQLPMNYTSPHRHRIAALNMRHKRDHGRSITISSPSV